MAATVRFYIDRRAPARGPARRLYAQVDTEQGRFRHFPGVEVNPECWDATNQKLVLPRGYAMDSKAFNDQLEAYRTRVMTAVLDLRGNLELVKQRIKLGENAPPPPTPLTVQEAIDLRLADRRSLDSKSTRAAYLQLRGLVEELAGQPLALAEVTYSFYAQLRERLLVQGQMNSSANRFLGKFKTVLTHVATKHGERTGEELAGKLLGLIKRCDMLPDDEPDIIPPTMADVRALAELDLRDQPELALTRDRYVFACFTGPRHSDLNTLDREFSLALDEGRFVLRYMPLKTKRRQPIEVPLNGFAHELLHRHLHSNMLFDAVDNRRENERLHRLLRDFGGGRFDNRVVKVSYQGSERVTTHLPRWQAITFHSSRHFFAITLINAGVPLEHVRDLLGQRNLTSTLRYAKVQAAEVRRSAEGVLDGLSFSPTYHLPG
jgi:site-specific recombinase XerD